MNQKTYNPEKVFFHCWVEETTMIAQKGRVMLRIYDIKTVEEYYDDRFHGVAKHTTLFTDYANRSYVIDIKFDHAYALIIQDREQREKMRNKSHAFFKANN